LHEKESGFLFRNKWPFSSEYATLDRREEYTLINGRIDALYSRLVIEYEPPHSLKSDNEYRTNAHAIEQIKAYIQGLAHEGRQKQERYAGVVLDGARFIFIRERGGTWHIEAPSTVTDRSTERFLKFLFSLSTERALTSVNLVEDFGEGTPIAQKAMNALFGVLVDNPCPKTKTLYHQWSTQFSEVCDYEQATKLKVEVFASRFAIKAKPLDPFSFFFCLHTYYTIFIKLLATQIVHFYAMGRLGTDLGKVASFGSEELKQYFQKVEKGGIFRELGIRNFVEGDFFGWYLEEWNEPLCQAVLDIVSALAGYSLVTLDVDPEETRDLLKELYEKLMPRELRHNLGEYYTPDWLAERLLNMLEGGKYKGDLEKRLLDPSCGSGTFLVLAIKHMKDYAWQNAVSEGKALDKILANVVGFDLNPLAVISARTNYLLALGDLLAHRSGDITIPVYLCDSIVTPQEAQDLFGKGTVKFSTVLGSFAVPVRLVHAAQIDRLAAFLEQTIALKIDGEAFCHSFAETFSLDLVEDKKDIEIVRKLYADLMALDDRKINGIWARIISNAFAPLFAGEFDYVAGNPPWINWESLPEEYRKSSKEVWISYGLFPHSGMDVILGKGKKDISMLLTYVAADKYLKKNGKLGFLITQSGCRFIDFSRREHCLAAAALLGCV
jgi:methylase of polypeptide subunit release factors